MKLNDDDDGNDGNDVTQKLIFEIISQQKKNRNPRIYRNDQQREIVKIIT